MDLPPCHHQAFGFTLKLSCVSRTPSGTSAIFKVVCAQRTQGPSCQIDFQHFLYFSVRKGSVPAFREGWHAGCPQAVSARGCMCRVLHIEARENVRRSSPPQTERKRTAKFSLQTPGSQTRRRRVLASATLRGPRLFEFVVPWRASCRGVTPPPRQCEAALCCPAG